MRRSGEGQSVVRVRVSKRGNRVWSSGKGEGRRGNEFEGQARVSRICNEVIGQVGVMQM